MRIPVNPKPKAKRVRAHIRIATLNMNGRGGPRVYGDRGKWADINLMIRDDKIGILALQETHLDASHLADIDSLWERLHVINSAHENATSTAGVAIVLNKTTSWRRRK